MGICTKKCLFAMSILALLVWVSLTCYAALAQPADTLPSWTDSPTKSAITRFVQDITQEEAAKYVRPEERIPIFVAGNVRSGGDIGQLYHSHTNPLPNFQMLINHDDNAREFAYAKKNKTSLKGAKEQGWQVVSKKNDWKRIFPFQD